jgi:hypothetical protein
MLLAMPLSILRIEAIPRELLWLPCILFVLFALPARRVGGWEVRRGDRDLPLPHWLSRWLAWLFPMVATTAYLGLLYLSSIVTWDGVLNFFAQHAFLVPVPFARG